MSPLDILNALRDLRQVFLERNPATIDVKFGHAHPLAGKLAAILVRERGPNGVEKYGAVRLEQLQTEAPVVAEEVVNHEFSFLPDFAAYGKTYRPDLGQRIVFVDGEGATLLFDARPEFGALTFTLEEHSARRLLMSSLDKGLTHEQFALLVDILKEYLPSTSAMLAKLCRVFQYSKTVEAELSTDGNNLLRTKFEGRGATDAPVSLPQEFELFMPYWANIDENAKLPNHLFVVTLRVVPPKGDEGPKFFLRLKNADEVKSEAERRFVKLAQEFLGEEIPVYRGTPDHKHNVVAQGE